MNLYIWFFTIALLTQIICSSPGHHGGPDLKALQQILKKLKDSEESLEEEYLDDELNDYFKHVAKMEEKHLKKLMRDELSQEEKAESKYYGDMLAKIKHMNDKKYMTADSEKREIAYYRNLLKQARNLKRDTLQKLQG